MHEPVHDECGTGHISGILEKGYEQIEYQDVGKENKDASHSADYSIHDKILQPSVRHDRGHECPEMADHPFYPLHRIFTYDKGSVKHKVEHEEEYREGCPFVRHYRIDLVGQRAASLLSLIRHVCLGQSSLHEGIFCIHNGGLDARTEKAVDPPVLFETSSDDLVTVRKSFNDRLDFLVIFKVLDCKITRGVLVSDVRILLYQQLDPVDAVLQFGSMIDVDMSRYMRIGLLIDLDHGVEKPVYALPGTTYGRHHRHSEKIAQLPDIQPVTLFLKLIIHIQGHDGAEVHVDELGGEVEISLEIGCVYNIHHDIRHLLHKIAAHIKFFRTICRQ